MKDGGWLALGIIGLLLIIIGGFTYYQSLRTLFYGGFSGPTSTSSLYTTMIIGGLGGIMATIGFVGFGYKRSKRAAKEIIRDSIREAEEEKKK